MDNIQQINSVNINEVCELSVFLNAFDELKHLKSSRHLCCDHWKKLINTHIRLLNRLMKNVGTNHGHRVKIQSTISHLKNIKIQINSLNTPKSGGQYKNKRSNRVRWEDLQTAFQSRIRTGVIINLHHKVLGDYFDDCFHLLKIRIMNILKKFLIIKINVIFCGEFIKKSINDDDVFEFKYFQTQYNVNDMSTDLRSWFKNFIYEYIMMKLEEFQERGSGWALSSIKSLEVNINKY